MIVEIAGLHQFACPVVKPFDAGLASFCTADRAGVGKAATLLVTLLLILCPYRRPHLQPALPIGAPQNFLQIFFGCLHAVLAKRGTDDFLLG